MSADVFLLGGDRRQPPSSSTPQQPPSGARAGAKGDNGLTGHAAGLRLHEGGGRPSVARFLSEAAQAAVAAAASATNSAQAVAIAVVVCGPSSMVDEVYAFTEEASRFMHDGSAPATGSGDTAGSRGDVGTTTDLELPSLRAAPVAATSSGRVAPPPRLRVQFHVHHETFNL